MLFSLLSQHIYIYCIYMKMYNIEYTTVNPALSANRVLLYSFVVWKGSSYSSFCSYSLAAAAAADASYSSIKK